MNAVAKILHRQRGITLIEVLVAFVIMALVVSVLFKIFSGGLRNVQLSDDYMRATILAESLLNEQGETGDISQLSTEQGSSGEFVWSLRAEPYEAPNAPLDSPLSPYLLSVQVSWGSADDPRTTGLSVIRLVENKSTGVVPR